MIPTIDNTLEYILADTENAQIILSEASKKMNETQPVSTRRSLHTVGEMEFRKFRRLFDRHRTAYNLFN